MDEAKVKALAEYGRIIKAHGWQAGEEFVTRKEQEIPEFRRWANALAIMLRTRELLDGR
jgi:hypothetical protein